VRSQNPSPSFPINPYSLKSISHPQQDIRNEQYRHQSDIHQYRSYYTIASTFIFAPTLALIHCPAPLIHSNFNVASRPKTTLTMNPPSRITLFEEYLAQHTATLNRHYQGAETRAELDAMIALFETNMRETEPLGFVSPSTHLLYTKSSSKLRNLLHSSKAKNLLGLSLTVADETRNRLMNAEHRYRETICKNN